MTKWAPRHRSSFGLPIYVSIAIIVLFVGGAMFFDWWGCSKRGRSFTEAEWGPVQGCMVLHNDRWLPLENIRGFDDK